MVKFFGRESKKKAGNLPLTTYHSKRRRLSVVAGSILLTVALSRVQLIREGALRIRTLTPLHPNLLIPKGNLSVPRRTQNRVENDGKGKWEEQLATIQHR